MTHAWLKMNWILTTYIWKQMFLCVKNNFATVLCWICMVLCVISYQLTTTAYLFIYPSSHLSYNIVRVWGQIFLQIYCELIAHCNLWTQNSRCQIEIEGFSWAIESHQIKFYPRAWKTMLGVRRLEEVETLRKSCIKSKLGQSVIGVMSNYVKQSC